MIPLDLKHLGGFFFPKLLKTSIDLDHGRVDGAREIMSIIIESHDISFFKLRAMWLYQFFSIRL